MNAFKSTSCVIVISFSLLLCGNLYAQRRVNWRQQERLARRSNAALTENGCRVSVELLSDDAGIDRGTMPSAVCDGNTHSRCVLWGKVRYRFDLVDTLTVTRINFICSDGAGEASPREIRIKLSDGTVIDKTLELLRPQRGRSPEPARQVVEVNADISSLEVTVLSMHPGAVEKKSGKPRMWGGLGEIEIVTTDDLAPYLEVPGYNPDAPSYLRAQSPRNDYSGLKVTMPTEIPLGQKPGIYLSADEIRSMAEKARTDPRATEMLEKLFDQCEPLLQRDIVLPDPAVPAQMADRNDAAAEAHNYISKMAGWLGWAYRLSDDERYAAKAREILVGYARLYPEGYKEHRGVHSGDTSKVMAQRLSEAMWLLPLIQSYDMVASAECFSDGDRDLVEKDLIRCGLSFINSKKSAAETVAARDRANPDWREAAHEVGGGPVGNWMNFYNAAYIQGGIAIGDRNWIDIGAANTRFMLARGIGEDGMWGEGAIGYQQFARHALVACIEPLARKGYDLWGYMDCRFKNLFDSGIKYAYPDSTAPGINDSGRTPIGGSWQAMAFDFAWLRYGDPNYGAIVNAAPRQVFQSMACYFPTVIYEKLPEKPIAGFGSMIFKNLGYAILRGEDGGSPTYLLMDYGRHGGSHGHPDKLNLVMYADGDELAGEPQGYRYEDRRHGDWTRPTIGHWTMSVDMRQQNADEGKLLCFADGGDIKVMRGTSGGAYTGVGLDRTVVQMPGYVLDVYRGWGKMEHDFDYPLAFRGELNAMKGVKADRLSPVGLPTQRGYKHILSPGAVNIDGDWLAVWSRDAASENMTTDSGETIAAHPANEVKVCVLGQKDSKVFYGQAPGDRHHAFVRRSGKDVVFVTLVDPYLSRDVVDSATEIALPGDIPARGIKVVRSDGLTDLVIVRFDPQTGGVPLGESVFEGITTDALVAVVRLNAAGQAMKMAIVGGTTLKYMDQELKLDEAGISFSK